MILLLLYAFTLCIGLLSDNSRVTGTVLACYKMGLAACALSCVILILQMLFLYVKLLYY